MIVNNANLDFIFIQGDLRFQAGLTQGAPTFYEKICTTVPSSTRENHYGFIDRLPGMREWLGERVIQNISAREYTLKNKLFEDSLALDRLDIEDDQLGLFNMSLDMLAYQVRVFPDKLVTSLIQHGEDATSLCYDGKAFFATDHPVNIDSGTTTWSNYDSTGKALTAGNFQAARAQMQGLVGSDGTPLGVYPTLLLVPPALEATARQILNAEFIAPGAAFGQNASSVVQTNVLKGSADLLVVPWLAGEDTTWYLLDTRFPIKPFIFQTREPAKFTYKNSPTDDNVFRLNKFVYGADVRCNAGYSLPFLAYKAVA